MPRLNDGTPKISLVTKSTKLCFLNKYVDKMNPKFAIGKALYVGNGNASYMVGFCHFELLFLFACFLLQEHRGVVPGGAGVAMAPPVFGRSINPISTRGGQIMPT